MNYYEDIIARHGEPPGKCSACGRCCRAVSLDDSPEALAHKMEFEREKLKRRPEHPHRELILKFCRDVDFILKNWRPISRAEAEAINPGLAGEGTADRTFYKCNRLVDQKCGAYEERPEVCRGYPWYGALPRPEALFAAPCTYDADIVWLDKVMAAERSSADEDSQT